MAFAGWPYRLLTSKYNEIGFISCKANDNIRMKHCQTQDKAQGKQ